MNILLICLFKTRVIGSQFYIYHGSIEQLPASNFCTTFEIMTYIILMISIIPFLKSVSSSLHLEIPILLYFRGPFELATTQSFYQAQKLKWTLFSPVIIVK